MAIVVADVGADAMLVLILANNLKLKLFATNVTPADTDTVATYTEASGGGYAEKTLTGGAWTISAGNDPSDGVYAAQTFTFTGPLTTNGTIYGYYVTDDAETTLWWAETLTAPFTPANNGDTLTITPRFRLSKGTPS